MQSARLYAGAIYLGGYALEALLKYAICRLLEQDQLPVLFHTHNLEALLFYSGLQRRMQNDPAIWDSFGRINTTWLDENRSLPRLRYADPGSVTATGCDEMSDRLFGPVRGVLPRLRNQL